MAALAGLLAYAARAASAREVADEDPTPRLERRGLPPAESGGRPAGVSAQGYLRLDLSSAFDSPDWGNAWRSDDTALRALAPELRGPPVRPAPAIPPSGFLLDGRPSSLPALVRTDRFLFTTVLYGGLGTYTDFEPFFGHGEAFNAFNPIAPSPATEDRITWMEGYVEPGLAVMGQVGCERLYA